MFNEICIYIYIYIYIYIWLLYNSSILDIEHFPYYIALGSTTKWFSDNQHSYNIYIYTDRQTDRQRQTDRHTETEIERAREGAKK